MACCSPEKLDPRAVDKDMANACCAQPHTPNYVGKVAYIMGPGSYAGGNMTLTDIQIDRISENTRWTRSSVAEFRALSLISEEDERTAFPPLRYLLGHWPGRPHAVL
jgi:hypothetical protein